MGEVVEEVVSRREAKAALELEEQRVMQLIEQLRAETERVSKRRESMRQVFERHGHPALGARLRAAPAPEDLMAALAKQVDSAHDEIAAVRRRMMLVLRAAASQAGEGLKVIEDALRADADEAAALVANRAPAPASSAPPLRRAARPDERRETRRHGVTVEVGFASENNFYCGFSTDLSHGGVFVATVDILPIGTPVGLTLMLPDDVRLEVEGVVRWTRECQTPAPGVWPGMGIQFVNLSKAAAVQIHAFVQQREPVFYDD